MSATGDLIPGEVETSAGPFYDPAFRRAGLAVLGAAMLALGVHLWPLGGLPDTAPPVTFAPVRTGLGEVLASAPFDPDRQPIGGLEPLPIRTYEAAMSALAAMPAPNAIAGILLDGHRSRVLFPSSDEGWKQQGDTIGDWLIETIDAEAVVLTRGSERVQLRPRDSLR